MKLFLSNKVIKTSAISADSDQANYKLYKKNLSLILIKPCFHYLGSNDINLTTGIQILMNKTPFLKNLEVLSFLKLLAGLHAPKKRFFYSSFRAVLFLC